MVLVAVFSAIVFHNYFFLGGYSKCEDNKGSLQARSYECELWNVANSSVQYTAVCFINY